MASTPLKAHIKVDADLKATEIDSVKKQKLDKLYDGGMGELVIFIIGPNKMKVSIHKQFVVLVSPVLKAAFESPMIEGQTQTYIVEDTTEGAFALFAKWAYTQVLDIQPKDTQTLTELNSEESAFVELWVLADKLLVTSLQNRTIDLIEKMRITHGRIRAGQVRYIYENTSSSSPLRRLLIDQMAQGFGETHFRRLKGIFPPDASFDLICALSRRVPPHLSVEPRVMAGYHVKED